MSQTISVVIPSYNYEHYLEQAVRSVYAQTYLPVELVIVDDCSTDGSWPLIQELASRPEYKRRFENIIIRKNEKNMGAHHTINDGATHSTGNYIAVLNADDLYEPERFSLMMEHLGSARFAFSAVRCIDEHGKRLEDERAAAFENIQKKIEGVPFMALSSVAENVCISTGNLLFERDLFLELYGFRNYKYVHDYDFFLRACLAAEPAYVPQTAYLYRLHGENSFLSLKKEGLRENRMVWLDFYHAVQKGAVTNPAILEHADYVNLFYAAVSAAGEKKQTLWKLSVQPLARAGLLLLKLRYKVH